MCWPLRQTSRGPGLRPYIVNVQQMHEVIMFFWTKYSITIADRYPIKHKHTTNAAASPTRTARRRRLVLHAWLMPAVSLLRRIRFWARPVMHGDWNVSYRHNLFKPLYIQYIRRFASEYPANVRFKHDKSNIFMTNYARAGWQVSLTSMVNLSENIFFCQKITGLVLATLFLWFIFPCSHQRIQITTEKWRKKPIYFPFQPHTERGDRVFNGLQSWEPIQGPLAEWVGEACGPACF